MSNSGRKKVSNLSNGLAESLGRMARNASHRATLEESKTSIRRTGLEQMIKENPDITRRQLSKRTSLEINVITPLVKSLPEMSAA